MKNFIFVFVAIFVTSLSINAQVAINTTGNAPNSYAMLDVSGSQKGILIPRISTSDRATMSTSMSISEEGLTVYDTDTQSFWYWDGTNWQTVGSAAMSQDKDWYKVGTTDVPTDITDNMFHTGQVAIGKNTVDTQLDIYSDAQSTLLKAKLENPNDIPLRLGAYFDVDGTAITTHGKVGVYSTVGGDPGTSSYPILEGFEAAVIGQDGVDKDEYGLYTYVTGNNNGTHVGLSTYLNGGGTSGDRYANMNIIRGNSGGNNYLFYGYNNNNGDGTHFGNFNLLSGRGNGIQYGMFNRIWNSGNEKKIGIFNEIYSTGDNSHTGTVNLLGARIDPNNPSNIGPVTGDGAAKRVGTSNVILGDGSGNHFGDVNNIVSTGNGLHVGNTNILGHDYVHNVNTITTGIHFGTVNNLTDTGDAPRIGTANLLSVTVDPNDPTSLTPLTGDSNASRVGQVNAIGGDGGGYHVASLNNVFSTGNEVHVGSTNLLGIVIDPTNPANSTPVSGDSNAKRVGEVNVIGGDGAGDHYGSINNIVSTGSGQHIGVSNVIGLTSGGTSIPSGTSKLIGSENIIGGTSSGMHVATINHIVSTGDGIHIASQNLVNGIGNGQQVASYNRVTNNGSGIHIAVYGEVDATDNTAMAGVFKGDVTARNYVTTIPFLAGTEVTNNTGTTFSNVVNVGSVIDPTIFNKLGNVEVKLVIRVTSITNNKNNHMFRLKAYHTNPATNEYPIVATDFTWTAIGAGKFMVSSSWKQWSAGTSIWDLILQMKNTDTSPEVKFDNVYLLVRPAQF